MEDETIENKTEKTSTTPGTSLPKLNALLSCSL